MKPSARVAMANSPAGKPRVRRSMSLGSRLLVSLSQGHCPDEVSHAGSARILYGVFSVFFRSLHGTTPSVIRCNHLILGEIDVGSENKLKLQLVLLASPGEMLHDTYTQLMKAHTRM